MKEQTIFFNRNWRSINR